MTSATAKSSEPTIDDILASIRRIIADEQTAEPTAAPMAARPVVDRPAGEDVLDLAQPLVRNAPPHKPTVVSSSPEAVTDGLVAAIRPKPVDPVPVLPPRPQHIVKPTPTPTAAEAPVRDAPASDGDRLQKLIAGEAEEALSAAFGRISALKVSTETKTLDGLVADLLRPMLKEWLDANLPAIAERLVRQEIERISAQTGR
jgi:cell pole-organizing protein PopZ